MTMLQEMGDDESDPSCWKTVMVIHSSPLTHLVPPGHETIIYRQLSTIDMIDQGSNVFSEPGSKNGLVHSPLAISPIF